MKSRAQWCIFCPIHICNNIKWQTLWFYDFIHIRPFKKTEMKLVRSCNFPFRYIDDVILLNNTKFGGFDYRIYTIDLEIKDTTHTSMSASCLDLRLNINSEDLLRTKLYDKRDEFNFPVVHFPSICRNDLAAPAYRVHTFQLIWYSRTCNAYHDSIIESCSYQGRPWNTVS